MKYLSTRGDGKEVYSSEAIIKGLADDGGLYVPEVIPKIDKEFINSMLGISYKERAKKILRLYLSDFTEAEIEGCVDKAYYVPKFDDNKIVPVKKIAKNMFMLELWHGPTSAFKDMALQILPHFIVTSLKKQNKKEELLILVATSGDTGKAALEGFRDVPQTKILVFYPNDGVSAIQKAQMVTQLGENVKVIAIQGNFDDAQSGVKDIFNNENFKKQLKGLNVELSSANSINWGRLLPQIVYYFSAYADLVENNEIKMGELVDFTVPTGNFGNILAGYYAKMMGLPVGNLCCASNSNNVLTDFLNQGIYTRNRAFYKTISPSMDILISSNLERLLYHLCNDSSKVSEWMNELKTKGSYKVDEETLHKIKAIFKAGYVSDNDTSKEIGTLYRDTKYIMDTHTAIAWSVANKMHSTNKMVVLSTASPYKFNKSVLEALKLPIDNVDEYQMLDILAEFNSQPIPNGLSCLKNAATIHKDLCTKEEMIDRVLCFVKE